MNYSLNASVTVAGRNIAIVNTPRFNGAFMQCQQSAVVACNGNTYNGAVATGATPTKKFVVNTNGTIDTLGGGLNYFPGDVAGTVDGVAPGAAPAQGAAGGVYA
jgi:hypothetical protein